MTTKADLLRENQKLRNELADIKSRIKTLDELLRAVAHNRTAEVTELVTELYQQDTSSKPPRRYTEDFRRMLVRDYFKGSRSMKQVCIANGVSEITFESWVKKYRQDANRPTADEPHRHPFVVLGDPDQ